MTGQRFTYGAGGRSRRWPDECQDCGWHRRVRVVSFWLNGFRMRMCEDCEKQYRPRLNRFPMGPA